MPLQHANRGASDIAVATGLPADLIKALRSRAERLRPFAGGRFEPSQPPALLDKLTDQLLVVASDVVTSVAAEASPALTGKATLRLLAWVVADARGATTPLDKALAETVGKRLDKQAQKVRETLAAASAEAAGARKAAHTAAAQDADLAPTLASVSLPPSTPSSRRHISAREMRSTLVSTSWAAAQQRPQVRSVRA